MIPAAEDTPQLQLLRRIAVAARAAAPSQVFIDGLPPPASNEAERRARPPRATSVRAWSDRAC